MVVTCDRLNFKEQLKALVFEMNTWYLVLTFLYVAVFLHPARLAKAPFPVLTRKVIKMEYMENCDQKVYPIMYVRYSFVRNGSNLVINGETPVSRDIKNSIKIQFRIEKCRDKSNPDTCEYYTTWKFGDLCISDHIKMPFLEALLDAYTPPFSCPVKKNNYYLRNLIIPMDSVEVFLAHGDSNVLWKFRTTLMEDASSTVACADFGIRFVKIRVRT